MMQLRNETALALPIAPSLSLAAVDPPLALTDWHDR
jgi:hypothetical protein